MDCAIEFCRLLSEKSQSSEEGHVPSAPRVDPPLRDCIIHVCMSCVKAIRDCIYVLAILSSFT